MRTYVKKVSLGPVIFLLRSISISDKHNWFMSVLDVWSFSSSGKYNVWPYHSESFQLISENINFVFFTEKKHYGLINLAMHVRSKSAYKIKERCDHAPQKHVEIWNHPRVKPQQKKKTWLNISYGLSPHACLSRYL